MTTTEKATRQQATRKLANVARLARVTYETARMELIGALSSQQMIVYDMVYKRGSIEAADVVTAMRLQKSHASGLLKELTDLGLLEREPIISSAGKRYIYRIK